MPVGYLGYGFPVRRRLPEILEVIVQKAAAGDKECAIYCVDRVLGRPRISLDQRLRTEVEISPDDYMRAVQKAQESAKMMLPSLEYEVLPAERQLTSPTRDVSHDPVSEVDITAPFERDVAEDQEGDVTRELSVTTRDDADDSTDTMTDLDG